MGLLTEGITEVIATTQANAAPMGLRVKGGEARMIIFRGTHTAQNIIRDGWVVANYSFDPVLFVRSAFEDIPGGMFQEEEAGGMTVQRLKDTEAWIAFSTTVIQETTEVIVVSLTPLREEIGSLQVHPVNRGFSGIIEAAVHATRYLLNNDPNLLFLIRHHASLVRRCGGPRDLEALSLLRSFLPPDTEI